MCDSICSDISFNVQSSGDESVQMFELKINDNYFGEHQRHIDNKNKIKDDYNMNNDSSSSEYQDSDNNSEKHFDVNVNENQNESYNEQNVSVAEEVYNKDYGDHGISFFKKKFVKPKVLMKKQKSTTKTPNIPIDIMRLKSMDSRVASVQSRYAFRVKNKTKNKKLLRNNNNENELKQEPTSLQLIEQKLIEFKVLTKKSISSKIIEIRKTRKIIIFKENALQNILINYIESKFKNEKNSFKNVFPIIYSLNLDDFFEIDFTVDTMFLKQVFSQCWNYFFPNSVRLTSDEINEISQMFDVWLYNSRYDYNYDLNLNRSRNKKEMNCNGVLPFKDFCYWFSVKLCDDTVLPYLKNRF